MRKSTIIIAVIGLTALVGGIFFWLPAKKATLASATVATSSVNVDLSSVNIGTNTIKVPILIYHSVRPYYLNISTIVKEFTVQPDHFRDQLKYLTDNGYTSITVDDLANHFNLGTVLPPKPVIITFDDGWENQYQYALPLLKEFKLTAVFYVYSNSINHKHFLTWDQLKELNASGMNISGHTKSHPLLSKITSKKVLEDEIAGSKKIIEDKIGKTINAFAYPFGAYNNEVVQVVKQSGYTSGRGVVGGAYHTKEDLFTLKGFIISDSFSHFVADLNS